MPHGQIVIDPGIGFGKTVEHNVALLAALRRLTRHGRPVLVGASRKRFIAALSSVPAGDPLERLGGTCAVTALAVANMAAIVRVHDVAANRQAIDVAMAISRATTGASPA